MKWIRDLLGRSPTISRVAPFVIFLLLTWLQGKWGGEASRYWFYLLKTVVGAWLIWAMYPLVSELRWKISLPAVIAGVGVFILWIGLDEAIQWMGFPNSYPKIGGAQADWNPHAQFGTDTALAWFVIAMRLLGTTLVVPPMEEVFYRSFLYRYIVKPDFTLVPFNCFHALAFFLTAGLFASTHREWLAALLCGFIYQGLVLRQNRLGDAITAHAITNFLLGLWVIWRGAWHFW